MYYVVVGTAKIRLGLMLTPRSQVWSETRFEECLSKAVDVWHSRPGAARPLLLSSGEINLR